MANDFNFPNPPYFKTREEIENLTDEQAWEVMRATRRELLLTLIRQEDHEHMLDDCGDYLDAATSNWAWMENVYFMNDGTGFTEYIKRFLLCPDNTEENGPHIGGSDGEIRHELMPEELFDSLYYGDQ